MSAGLFVPHPNYLHLWENSHRLVLPRGQTLHLLPKSIYAGQSQKSLYASLYVFFQVCPQVLSGDLDQSCNGSFLRPGSERITADQVLIVFY